MNRYDEEDEEPLDYGKLAATELAELCLNLYEAIQREKSKVARRPLVKQYNEAANYYNTNIQKVMTLC